MADPSPIPSRPVLEAGLACLHGFGDRVAGCLEARDAAGHTPGQLAYWFRSKSHEVVFCGDILHHPVHVLRPGWNSIVDLDGSKAAETRAAFLDEAAETGTLVAPCHFAPPHCGFVGQARDGFGFVSGPSGTPLPAQA